MESGWEVFPYEFLDLNPYVRELIAIWRKEQTLNYDEKQPPEPPCQRELDFGDSD